MGNSGGIPDIGVRLSAQGVSDVIAAFSRVRQEGKKTGTETAASLELINGALEQMKELLPAISFAIVVDKLVDIGLSAREAAENLGKLSDKTGASIGTLSALNLVAHDTEVSQESLGNGLVKLAKSQQDASDGAVKQQKAFKDLGIALSDLKTQDPGQLFATVAQKLETLPDGAQKAQIAIALFGKSGADLLPMLKSLGADGFDAAVEKAKKLGLYLNGDMVAAAAAAQDALHELGDIVTGLGTQFDAGFLPSFTHTMNAFAEGLAGQGVDAVKVFGEETGNVFAALAKQILQEVDDLAFFVQQVKLAVSEYQSLEAHFNGFFDKSDASIDGALGLTTLQKSAQAAYANDIALQKTAEATRANANADYESTISKLKQIGVLLAKPETTKPASPDHSGVGATGNGQSDQQAQKAAQAKSAFLQAQADNELAILKLKNQLEEAEDQRSYAAGTLTLDQYYDRRAARIKAEADAELAILAAKQKAVAALPDATPEQDYKKQQAAAAVLTQITAVQLKEQSQLKQNADDLSKAQHDAAIAALNDTEKLQKASGDKYGAEETALQIELQQYTELLEKQKKSADEINEAVSAYRQRAQAAIDFGRNQETGSSAMTNLNLGIGDIQNQAANGSISNIAAQAQINQLQQDSLATLSAIGLQMFKNAALSGDIKNIDAANQYNAGLQKIASSLTNVTTAQTYLVNQLSTQGVSALADFFTAGISGSKSFGDALGDLATAFENIIARMISQLLIFYALEAILGLVGVPVGTITAIIGTGPFSKGFDDGGYTANIPTNQVAGVVHGKEWVATAAQTAKYRPLFDMIMAGTLDKALQEPSVIPRSAMAQLPSDYADSVAGGPGAAQRGAGVSGLDIPAPIINVTNTTGQPSTQKQSTGSGGASVTDIIIGAIATDIAKGGKVAQAMQSNYGVTRQGVRRG